MRDIVRMPADAVEAMFADRRVRAALSVHAEALIADDEASDALGVGTDRFATLEMPTTLVDINHSATPCCIETSPGESEGRAI
ncbi:hypothetical protein ACWD6R_25840 [Streptomyces sp. NPDC005151]